MEIGKQKEGKDPEQACVINPRRRPGEDPVSPAILMGFVTQDLALIRKSLGANDEPTRRVDFARLWECPVPWEGVSVTGPALGAPAAALLMERLIALGAGCIVSVGSCGSLQPDVNIGQVILPTDVLIEEGTSPHYQAAGVDSVPEPSLLAEIRTAFHSHGIRPREGTIWTTDAPFRETIEKVKRYREMGILGVEMEASALMTIASFRKVSFVSVLVVSDEVGSLKWKRGFQDQRFLRGLADAAEVTGTVLAQRVSAMAQVGSHGKNR